jgi:hypothetical protein
MGGDRKTIKISPIVQIMKMLQEKYGLIGW